MLCAWPDPSIAIESDSCTASGSWEERLKAVGPRGELAFASGATGVLRSIRWPDEAEFAKQADAWLSAKQGTTLSVTIHGKPDRWGRVAVDAAQGGDDLAAGLVSAGLARVDSGEADAFCRHDLLAMEDETRSDRIGLWQSAVADATDGVGIAGREGEFVVAQGRVLSVAERLKRTYLNFTTREKRGLSVTVSKRTWRIMLARGLTADTLRGRFVRVRGTVELWQGPMLDIASADMIEVLDGSAAPRR